MLRDRETVELGQSYIFVSLLMCRVQININFVFLFIGGLQYVMYVPSFVQPTAAEQTQNYENVVYTTGEDTTSSYQAPEPQVQQKAQTSYVQPEGKGALTEYVIKREPKSLLDSYIPSVLQLQYYKQAQSQQNSIQEPIKIPRTFNSKSHYRPTAAESSIRYTYRPSTYRS